MSNASKKYLVAVKQVQPKLYSPVEAIALIKKVAYAKFDESIDLAFKLGVDPRHADQMVRGALVMPAGTGKKVRVIVISSGDKIKEALDAGADEAGADDLITKIAGGWLDFDRVIATPEMMAKAGKIARILGPRGLMPNPKLGTVVTDVAKAVKEQKSGKVEYRTDKTGIVHVAIGKKSFPEDKILENFKAMITAILRAKPSASKGTYLQSLTISTTMGPGVKLDTLEVINLA
ncbi:MAG: 50S ribosomal protein L1 [Bacteriovoracaceae bacterium]|nr:50S ribosomal protein L1 [Bacteriovoracaceae bacterium]